ncbi:diguanylate cyclase [Aquabacter sp. L1I39]|uniref:sensor domain-containing diguanylate cyclase n=1 Tax=Aquabacter sp. L1I39 TaxID=2820278 RepID=UPI001ADCAB59|nr:sensor domain-containing diguanylate cyclase [Aquabacter sp. L1I39]QTL04635.1 diguanylate cyclase [Aquabacter sp. L1I39]
MMAAVLMVAAIVAIQSYTLWQARQDTWTNAVRGADNVLTTLVAAIERNLTLIEVSLAGVQEGLRHTEIQFVSPELRNLILFDRATAAEHVDAVLVLSPRGDIVFDSRSPVPRSGNFSDRDFFRAQRDRDVGTFLGKPSDAGLEPGIWQTTFSRRLTNPDGSFGGVVAASLRSSYFDELFSALDLGPGSILTLMRTDGTVVERRPTAEPNHGAGVPVAGNEVFQAIAAGRSSGFTAVSMYEQKEKYFLYKRIPGFPLVLIISIPIETVLKPWRMQAIVVGLLTVCVGGLILFLVAVVQRALIRSFSMADRLKLAASTDFLTGLTNRRDFDRYLAVELQRAARDGSFLSLVMVDADRFKLVNDRHGHLVGDELLREIATSIRRSLLRPGDLASRYGGEEFAIVLPVTDSAGARVIAERIRKVVEATSVPLPDGSRLSATVSVGGVTAVVGAGARVETLVRRADEALYMAKGRGRNCAVLLEGLGADSRVTSMQTLLYV